MSLSKYSIRYKGLQSLFSRDSLRQSIKYYDSMTESDSGLIIQWSDGNKEWPFWIHESCVSEIFEHIQSKAFRYVHGCKLHISILSILNLEDRKNKKPGQSSDWRVDLSIWRIGKELRKDNKYCSKPEILLDRVEVYSTISKPPSTITIFKQDLVTLHRHEHQGLLDIKMDVIFSDVYAVTKGAVEQMKRQQQNLSSSSLSPDQLDFSFPFIETSNASYQDEEESDKDASQRMKKVTTVKPASRQSNREQKRVREEDFSSSLTGGSNCSYQDEEESEKAASQAEIDDSLTLVAGGSQDDLQKDVDDEEASTSNSSGRMVKVITMKSASRQSNTGQKTLLKSASLHQHHWKDPGSSSMRGSLDLQVQVTPPLPKSASLHQHH